MKSDSMTAAHVQGQRDTVGGKQTARGQYSRDEWRAEVGADKLA